MKPMIPAVDWPLMWIFGTQSVVCINNRTQESIRKCLKRKPEITYNSLFFFHSWHEQFILCFFGHMHLVIA
jgi:hypothetical protein